jgi:class 3 adenylate cyclase/tetratricopeptide (TPR) repeat protein
VRCNACDAALIVGKPFCPMCGARATQRCGNCGGALDPQFRFCPQCGQPVGPSVPDSARAPGEHRGPELPAPAVAPEASAGVARPHPAPAASGGAPNGESAPPAVPLDGERKQVTVLFCDLVGSTAIAERLDPEEYRELIDRYLERVFPEVYRFGGIVNTLAGDGLMALFGAPIAHEDDPRRAVRAALAIRETLGALADTVRAERAAIELQARIGIHTGPVVVGTVGNSFKMDYTAIGDTTNLAARLQTAARPGAILVSEATHRLVRGFFVVEPTGPLDVRGKSEPVTAYEVLGRATRPSPMTIAAERGLTPLVGRQAELARLEVAFRRVAHGALRVVAVVGEAGSGKSRLLYEFRRRLEGRPVTFFEGRCSSMNQLVPFHPMLSMLRNFFELAPDDPPDVAQERLSSKIGVQYGHVEQMYPLLSRFLSLPGGRLELPGDDFKREISDAVAELVLHEPGPVVVVLEDLHWVDEASIELFEALLARLATAPVLVVVTHRPEGDPRWRPPGDVEKITLGRLATDEVRAILHAVAGGPLPVELESALVQKAAGSPFFAEELVRTLVEVGHLDRSSGEVRLSRPIAEVPIPDTIHEVVAARLDRLGPQAKRVVQVAGVLGRQFSRAHLSAILADEQIDVDQALDELVRRGILHRKTALGGDQLRFGESLTQEIAYEGLLLRQRRQLHERVARHLDRQPGAGPERSALLAHHWSRSDDRRRAAEALIAAARDAENVPSYNVAADFYRRAWEAAEAASGELPDDRLLRLALDATAALSRLVVYFGLPLVDVAARAAERGRQLAEYFHDSEATASFFYMLGVMTMTRDGRQFARGLALAERGLALAEGRGLRLAAARIIRGLCINYVVDGRFEQARERIDAMLAVMEASEDPAHPGDLYLSARWVKDMLLYANDELDAALEHVSQTLDLGVRANNRTVRCASSAALAQTYCLRGDYERAKAFADEALALGEQIGNMNVFPAAASVALIARAELGERIDPAHHVDCIEKGLAAAGFMQLNVRFVTEALMAVDDLDRAELHAEALYGVVGGRLRQALVGVAFGDVMQRRGRLERAHEAYSGARTVALEIGARSALVGAIIGLGEVALARGDVPDAGELERAQRLCAALHLGRYTDRLARVVSPPPLALASS